uniref:diguanylate cyclase domain-containing protein n=1 Tax=Deinococcus detaillensis TaxID=2592048 RepID=UPI00384DFA73
MLQTESLPPDYRITASLGLTCYRAGETLEANLERTDTALYEAKHRGRNCTVLDESL